MRKYPDSIIGKRQATLIVWLADTVMTFCALLLTDHFMAPAHHGTIMAKAVAALVLAAIISQWKPANVFYRTARLDEIVSRSAATAVHITLLAMVAHAFWWRGRLIADEFLVFFGLLLCLMAVSRLLLATTAARIASASGNQLNVLLVCAAGEARSLSSMITAESRGINVSDTCLPEEALDYLPNHTGLDAVYCTTDALTKMDAQPFCLTCKEMRLSLVTLPPRSAMAGSRLQVLQYGTLTALSSRRPALSKVSARIIKRVADILLCLLLLLTVFPLLTFAVALVTKKQSRGAILSRQTICGMNGEPFPVYVFRSEGFAFGRFLQRTGLEQWPLLFSVLTGHMSFVGSTTITPSQSDTYHETLRQHMGLGCKAKPGLFATPAIGGTTCEAEMERRVEADIWYTRNWTPWLDLGILLNAVGQWLRGKEQH